MNILRSLLRCAGADRSMHSPHIHTVVALFLVEIEGVFKIQRPLIWLIARGYQGQILSGPFSDSDKVDADPGRKARVGIPHTIEQRSKHMNHTGILAQCKSIVDCDVGYNVHFLKLGHRRLMHATTPSYPHTNILSRVFDATCVIRYVVPKATKGKLRHFRLLAAKFKPRPLPSERHNVSHAGQGDVKRLIVVPAEAAVGHPLIPNLDTGEGRTVGRVDGDHP